jgi:hypothetical protein
MYLTISRGSQGVVSGTVLANGSFCGSTCTGITLSYLVPYIPSGVTISLSQSGSSTPVTWTLTITASSAAACYFETGTVNSSNFDYPVQVSSVGFRFDIVGCGGGGCVANGTSISTSTGSVLVQSLIVGQSQIELYDIASHETSYATLRWLNYTSQSSLLVRINGGLLLVTGLDQPLYITNGTWTGILQDPWNLTVGESLFDPLTGHWVPVTSIQFLTSPGPVYDVSVGLGHTEGYIAAGVVVFSKTPAT